MDDLAIRCEGLSKRYRVGRRERYRSLRDSLARAVGSPFNLVRGAFGGSAGRRGGGDTIWALSDVSFEVKRGEVVGIIGRNGAGKSTLLKILSRITKPTAGYVKVRGHVGSMLEVGTGFHPELTGRENIYLNGAILGMKRAEIVRKFDEIVAFAEVEGFIDAPVKHYSSGMYMRLAFAVTSHLESEILLVDEVLAVGDAPFQKKCLGKMGEVAKEGQTVLFVSHNLAAVQSLCRSGFVLEQGRVLMRGTSGECVREYLDRHLLENLTATISFAGTSTSPRMLSATVLCNGVPSATLHTGDSLSFEIAFAADSPTQSPGLGFVISSAGGERLLNANSHYQQGFRCPAPLRRGKIRCDLGMVPLMAGRYFISLWFGDSMRDTHVLEDAVGFEVVERDVWGKGLVPPALTPMWWQTTFRLAEQEGESGSDS